MTRPSRTRRIRAAALGGAVAVAGFGLTGCTPEATINSVFGPVAPQAIAIARCESGLNPSAVSPTNDHGLFQINVVHQGSFSRVTGQPWAQVYNPHWNSVFAKHLYDTQGWRPWSCKYVLGR